MCLDRNRLQKGVSIGIAPPYPPLPPHPNVFRGRGLFAGGAFGVRGGVADPVFARAGGKNNTTGKPYLSVSPINSLFMLKVQIGFQHPVVQFDSANHGAI